MSPFQTCQTSRRAFFFAVLTVVAALMSAGIPGDSYGQRVRFPTTAAGLSQDGYDASGGSGSVYQRSPTGSTAAPSAPGSGTPGTSGPGTTSANPAPGTYAAPGTGSSVPYTPGVTSGVPSPWDGAPPPAVPSYGPGMGTSAIPPPSYPPGSVPYYAPGGPTVAPGPGAPYAATGVPPPSWDPYATPGSGPSSVFPQGGIFPGLQTNDFVNSAMKFREAVGFRYMWIPDSSHLGVNDVDLFATFAFPFLRTDGPPLRVTPGFTFHWWSGPESTLDPASPDMPPTTYDAYLDAAWEPSITPVLGGELDFRIGVYSDFRKVTSDSLRFQGRGLLSLALTPNWKIKGGVMYLDRVRVKTLPTGGAIWVDNPNDPSMEISILFPNPRFAMRLPQASSADWWWYVRGDYGGDSWTIKRSSGINAGAAEQVDYNDIRLATGLEFYRLRGFRGYAELGISFSRELVYEAGFTDQVKPSSALFFGGGLAY